MDAKGGFGEQLQSIESGGSALDGAFVAFVDAAGVLLDLSRPMVTLEQLWRFEHELHEASSFVHGVEVRRRQLYSRLTGGEAHSNAAPDSDREATGDVAGDEGIVVRRPFSLGSAIGRPAARRRREPRPSPASRRRRLRLRRLSAPRIRPLGRRSWWL